MTATPTTTTTIITISKEYQELVPRMPEDEYKALKEDIKQNGQDRPIVVNQNYVMLDGHHRFRACQELGIECKYEVKEFDDSLKEKLYVINSALLRRQLDIWQKGQLVLKKKPILEEIAKRNMSLGGKGIRVTNIGKPSSSIHVQKELAKQAGISKGILNKIEQINKAVEESPNKKLELGYDKRTYTELKEALDKGKARVSKIHNIITRDQKCFRLRADTEAGAEKSHLKSVEINPYTRVLREKTKEEKEWSKYHTPKIKAEAELNNNKTKKSTKKEEEEETRKQKLNHISKEIETNLYKLLSLVEEEKLDMTIQVRDHNTCKIVLDREWKVGELTPPFDSEKAKRNGGGGLETNYLH